VFKKITQSKILQLAKITIFLISILVVKTGMAVEFPVNQQYLDSYIEKDRHRTNEALNGNIKAQLSICIMRSDKLAARSHWETAYGWCKIVFENNNAPEKYRQIADKLFQEVSARLSEDQLENAIFYFQNNKKILERNLLKSSGELNISELTNRVVTELAKKYDQGYEEGDPGMILFYLSDDFSMTIFKDPLGSQVESHFEHTEFEQIIGQMTMGRELKYKRTRTNNVIEISKSKSNASFKSKLLIEFFSEGKSTQIIGNQVITIKLINKIPLITKIDYFPINSEGPDKK